MNYSKQPKTAQRDFVLSPLRTHFIKSPNPPGANRLIDLPLNEFLDTEDEFNVVAAGIWMLSVKWDEMPEDKRPKTRTTLREWILVTRDTVLEVLLNKVEPPFTEWSAHHMHQDVATLSDELLAQTLPADKKDPVCPQDDKPEPERDEKAQ